MPKLLIRILVNTLPFNQSSKFGNVLSITGRRSRGNAPYSTKFPYMQQLSLRFKHFLTSLRTQERKLASRGLYQNSFDVCAV